LNTLLGSYERILFLDICDVLNTHGTFLQQTNVCLGKLKGDVIDRNRGLALSRILRHAERTGNPVHVIGVSSWFSSSQEMTEQDKEFLKRFDNELGLKISELSCMTGGGTSRTKGILDLLVKHKPKYWCILDDQDHWNQPSHPFYDSKPYYDIGLHHVQPQRFAMNDNHFEQLVEVLALVQSNYQKRNVFTYHYDYSKRKESDE
jgi:hypothetical protein